jgi:putative Mg2+ transporter-C (MgtC) family protein
MQNIGCALDAMATLLAMNTAATIWCSWAIGSLAGTGVLHCALTAAVVILINVAFRPLTYRLNPPSS